MSSAGPRPARPVPLSEWLDLMLNEIDRKQAEASSAAEESARRSLAEHDDRQANSAEVAPEFVR